MVSGRWLRVVGGGDCKKDTQVGRQDGRQVGTLPLAVGRYGDWVYT